MRNPRTTLAVASIFFFGIASAAFAWSAHLDKTGKTYGIHNGSTVIDMGLTQKQARKLAKKLNEIQKKDEEEGEE